MTKKLNNKHVRFMVDLCARLNVPITKVCSEILGVSPNTLYRWNSNECKASNAVNLLCHLITCELQDAEGEGLLPLSGSGVKVYPRTWAAIKDRFDGLVVSD